MKMKRKEWLEVLVIAFMAGVMAAAVGSYPSKEWALASGGLGVVYILILAYKNLSLRRATGYAVGIVVVETILACLQVPNSFAVTVGFWIIILILSPQWQNA